MTVSLNANDLSSAKITGSVMQDDWDKNEQQKQPLVSVKNSINKEMWKLSSAGNTPQNHKAHELLRLKVEKSDKKLNQVDYKFITTHSNSYLSAYLTRYYYTSSKLSRDSAAGFYKTFTPAVKQSIAGMLLQKEILNK